MLGNAPTPVQTFTDSLSSLNDQLDVTLSQLRGVTERIRGSYPSNEAKAPQGVTHDTLENRFAMTLRMASEIRELAVELNNRI